MFETAYAMGQQGGQSGGGSFLALIYFVPILLIIYFMLFRPQQKRQKEHQRMLTELRKGDKVITNSGMFGTVVGINEKENKIVLKVSENVKIEFLKSSVAGRVGKEEG